MKIKIIAPPERKYSVWIGGSILASLHLPADVDLQGRVRRVWPQHCPPQVLLSARLVQLWLSLCAFLIMDLVAVVLPARCGLAIARCAHCAMYELANESNQ